MLWGMDMKRWCAALAGCLVFTAAHAGSPATPQTTYDRIVDDAVARYHLPGIAVGVVEDGKVVYTRTVGELEAGSGQKIDAQSIFKIASNTKAMTASVLARLVDQGKLRWDDPVTKYLPDFKMHDAWVTREMQVRDLLVHNSGLPEGGGDLMLWPEPNLFTRADIVHGLQYIKPAYSFRSGYAYDNLLYVVAGEVAAAAGGASYETLVQREIFTPLGLDRCRVGAFDRADVGNVAQPHVQVGGRYVPGNVDAAQVPAITSAAAGGIRCSLDDMLVWMRNWLVPDAQQQMWLSPQGRRAMWVPRTPMPIAARRARWDNTHMYAYGYGFRLADVDGQWTVSHTGTLSGMYSMMALLPDRRGGFVFLINADADDARTVLGETLMKQFTAPQSQPSIAKYAKLLAEDAQPAPTSPMQKAPKEKSALVAPTQPRSPVATPFDPQRIGTWQDPWFGIVRLCPADGKLRFASEKSHLMVGTLMQVGDRWLVDWDNDRVDLEAWMDFEDGHMRLRKTDPEGDFSSDYEDLDFTRVAGC
jgi:CubicO group peptidase (beta-lactamase class C family)